MSRSQASRWVRPVVLVPILVFVALAASFFYESRPRPGVDVAAPGAEGTSSPTGSTATTTAFTDSTFSTTTVFGGTSSATPVEPTAPITDFGPPVTVGDYTRFCPALDELAILDSSRADMAAADSTATDRWQADRRHVLSVIDESLNYRSAEADAAIIVLLATNDDHPNDGPLSPAATEAMATIHQFAEYSCEVNTTLPSTAQPPTDEFPTTTGP